MNFQLVRFHFLYFIFSTIDLKLRITWGICALQYFYFMFICWQLLTSNKLCKYV